MADEIIANSFELRPTSREFYWWITQGFDDPGTVRGVDAIIDGLPGRFVPPVSRVKDTLIVGMKGWVVGQGATEAAARQNYRESMDDLLTNVFDGSLAPYTIEVHGPVMGIASGMMRTLNARFLDVIWNEWMGGLARSGIARFECVDSPPVWSEMGSS
jgi:hypothetical protein